MLSFLLVALIQQPAPAPADSVRPILLLPAAVWDGVADARHPGWTVLVRGDRIAAVGPADRIAAPTNAKRVELPGTTLLPGTIRS